MTAPFEDFGTVDMIEEPGAPMSTLLAPQHEKLDIAPVEASEATAMMPAAATNTMLRAAPASMASLRPCEKPPPPHELLVATMFRPWRTLRSVKYCTALMALAVVPPRRPRKRPLISLTPLQHTPATPLPLPPAPAIVPDTCVPWSSLAPPELTLLLLPSKSQPFLSST